MKKQLLLISIITLGALPLHGQQSFNHLHAYYLTTGEDAQATGEFATALVNGQAFGDNSLAALGAGTYGPGSVAIGEGNIANGRNQTVLGLYNLPQGNPNAAPSLTDDLLIVGNGTAHNARSNALTIKRNGDLRLFGNLAFPGASATGTFNPHYTQASNPANGVSLAGRFDAAASFGSIAWGAQSIASYNSLAFGLRSHTQTRAENGSIAFAGAYSKNRSFAFGSGNLADNGQFVIGAYNRPQNLPNDALFVIGNGHYNGGGNSDVRSNALTVAKNGATRINGTLTVKTKIRVAPAGDIPMGNYTSGSNPANEDY